MDKSQTIPMILLTLMILTTSQAFANTPFMKTANELKSKTVSAQTYATDLDNQSRKISDLSLRIKNMAVTIRTKGQKEQISNLEKLINKFQERVHTLKNEVDSLQDLTIKMQAMSNKMKDLALPSSPPPAAARSAICPPGKHWVSGFFNRRGQRIPGHCQNN